MQFVGNGTVGPADINGAQGIGSALNGIASAFMDGGQQQMRAAQLMQGARAAAAAKGLGDVFANGGTANAAAALANGAPIGDVLMSQGAYGAHTGGLDSPLLNENLAAGGHFAGSPTSQARSEAANAAAATAARADAPVKVVMPDGSLAMATMGNIPKGAQPLVGTDEGKGAIIQHNLLPPPGGVGSVFATPGPAPTAVGGNMPGAAPAAADATAAPDAPVMSADARTLIGLDKADKTLNYQVPGPDGKPIATGRTVDGKTDLTTGAPLPQNAMIAGTGGGGVTVNTGAETAENAAVGKAKGDLLGKAMTAGEDARTRMSLLAQLSEAAKAGGNNITTGPLADYVMKGKEALGSAFGTQLDGTAPAEVINKLGFQLATQLTKAISSRPTQAEFLRALQNVPGLLQSPQGRDALISLSMQQAKAESDLAGIAANSKNYGEYLPQENAYYAAHPLISPFSGKPFGADDVAMVPGAAAPAATAVPNGPGPGVTHVWTPDGGIQPVKPQ